MKTYEGMFLLDAGQSDIEQAAAPIQAVLGRHNAEVVQMKKWDERRLAYEINGRRRGLYVLTYFKAAPEAIGEIERDVQLDEGILRVLILSADHVSDEMMQAPTPADTETQRREADRSESEKQPAGAVADTLPDEAPRAPAAEDEREQTSDSDIPAEQAPLNVAEAGSEGDDQSKPTE